MIMQLLLCVFGGSLLTHICSMCQVNLQNGGLLGQKCIKECLFTPRPLRPRTRTINPLIHFILKLYGGENKLCTLVCLGLCGAKMYCTYVCVCVWRDSVCVCLCVDLL